MDEQKNCPGKFKIRQYPCFNVLKRDQQKKIAPGI